METPSSTRRVTRSQTSIASQKAKKEDSLSKSRTTESRPALIDITNDSPIVGLATDGNKTPSASAAVKSCVRAKNTPGSGEALLRGQVKTLLQKVEEEAEFISKIPPEHRPPFEVVLCLPCPSPVQLAAPTPANTPQVLGLSETATTIQVAEAVMPEAEEEEEEEEECSINRALLFDSPEKVSEVTDDAASTICSSVSYQDDSSSAWSVQVNVSEKEEEEEEEEEEIDDEEEAVEYDYDELCEGLSKMTVKEVVEFGGKHTRFVYNSDDEIERAEEVVMLKGLPVPEGKHLRFKDDEE